MISRIADWFGDLPDMGHHGMARLPFRWPRRPFRSGRFSDDPEMLASERSGPGESSGLVIDVYVAGSRLGRGLFAARAFAPGDPILTFTGRLLTLEQVIALGEAQANPLQVDDRLYIDIGYPGVYANHSCRPNAGIRNDVELVALEPIAARQEILWDYSTSMWEDYWVMDCQCGEASCRARVGDFPTLPAWQQQDYLRRGVVQRFIRRRLLAGSSW